MIYALDEAGGRIAAEKGRSGICGICSELVIPKCGAIKAHHWAHKAGTDCDRWSEPETPWHLQWKSLAPKERVEVVMGPHRADVVSPAGIVIELQHSSITAEEAREREQFYGKMIWLFDAAPFKARIEWINRGTAARPHAAFLWRNCRPVHWVLEMPTFWDFGEAQIFAIRGMHSAAGGDGQWIHKVEFINRYF